MENKHKQKCEELRRIRIHLAEKLGVSDKIKQTPCEFKGECKGTCPACEAEEKFLNKALLVKTAAIAGTALALTGCGEPQVLSGEVQRVDVEENRETINRIKATRDLVRHFNIQDELEGEAIVEGIEILPDDTLSGDIEITDEEFIKDWVSKRTFNEISDIYKYITTQSDKYNESEGDLLVTTSDGEIFYIEYDDIDSVVRKIELAEESAKLFDVPTEGLAEAPPTFTGNIPTPGNKISGLSGLLEDLFY